MIAAEFSADGRQLLTASFDGTAQVWDAQSGSPLAGPMRHRDEIRSASFSRDGSKVITASRDKTARVWDARTGQPLTPPLQHDGQVFFAEFNLEDDKVVTASNDMTVRLWDAGTGQPLGPPLRHRDAVLCARFSPDGRKLVTATEGGYAWLWNVRTGQPLDHPMQHQERIRTVEFSPDGTRVLTASEDHTARVWDAGTGVALTEPLAHQALVNGARFSPDGTRVITASNDGTAAIWEVPVPPQPMPAWLDELVELLAEPEQPVRISVPRVTWQRLRQIREELEAGGGNDFYSRWGRWFFSDRATRTTGPFSGSKASDSVEARFGQPARYSLLELLPLQPANTATSLRLCYRAALGGGLQGSPLLLGAMNHVIRHEAERRPHDRVFLWAAIDRVLRPSQSEDILAWLDRLISMSAPATVRRPSGMLDGGLGSPAALLTAGAPREEKGESLLGLSNLLAARAYLLETSSLKEQARDAYAQALSLARECSLPADQMRRGMLMNHAALLKHLGRLAEAQADYRSEWNIPQRDPLARPNLIDLSAYYNAALDEICCSAETTGNWGLPSVTDGVVSAQGLDCDIRGIVQLSLRALMPLAPVYPGRVDGIRVGGKHQRLRFVHGTIGGVPDGTQVGTYLVRYANGEQREARLIYGRDLRDPFDDLPIEKGTALILGPNPAGQLARLSCWTWENPLSEVEITSLDFVSSMSDAAPFLVAITGE